MSKKVTITKEEAKIIASNLVKRYNVTGTLTAKDVIDMALADGLVKPEGNTIVIWGHVSKLERH